LKRPGRFVHGDARDDLARGSFKICTHISDRTNKVVSAFWTWSANQSEVTMQELKIVPMSTAIAESVRSTMRAPVYGFPAHREQAAGRAPCRHCLKLIRPHEEELVLFTFDAFHGQGVPPMPGPVYIHAESCSPFVGNGRLPEEYRGQPLTFEAFGEDRKRVGEMLINKGDADAALQELFHDPAVIYAHARSTTAGCYLFRVERAEPGEYAGS
jgi:Protein of unknown function (DUF1203)